MTELLSEHMLSCPYCGESISLLVDSSAGDQRYIEDCQVCCRPIQLQLHVSSEGAVSTLIAQRDDE